MVMDLGRVNVMHYVIVLLQLSLAHGAIQKVCQESFIMDTFCLERGTLLDNPSVKTLANPEKHTVHCLVDVPRCYDSGFEILGPKNTSSGYCRAFALDTKGNELALALARNTGDCSTCTKPTGGQKVGFRATIKGTYDDAATTLPYALTVDSVEDASVGCDGVGYTPINPCATASSSNALSATQQLVLAHGSLMLVSWGVILPMGVLAAHFLRHRDPTWFKAHRAMQTFGLLCALGGFVIAITQFSVFAPGYYGPAQAHGSMGLIVMILGLLQPLNAFFRPHNQPGEEKSKNRQYWEYLHKGSGYFAIVLAIPTIVLGTTLVGGRNTLNFLIGAGVVFFLLVVFGLTLAWDRRNQLKKGMTTPATKEMTNAGSIN